MHISELDTPAVLVDLDVMERNLASMAEYSARTGMKLRPHVKTHKIPELALQQVSMGAVGITAAKPSEAQVMAAGGLKDIFIAYPIVSKQKADALLALKDLAKLSVSVDSFDSAECLASASTAIGYDLPILVEIDVGFGRCGVATPELAVDLARKIEKLNGAHFGGLMFYPGHMMVPLEEQNLLLPKVNAAVEAAYAALVKAGLDVPVVSGGSTPMAPRSTEFSHLTEIRPGMYPLNDRNLVAGGFATLENCALTVMTTVVSTAVNDRVILDGGSKTFSSDRLLTGDHLGHGVILADADAVLYGLSEEHGHIDVTNSSRAYKLGERLRVVPNHVCATINMHDTIYGIRGEQVETVWKVAARGRVQ
ncbi:D-serine deaminase-like pyridoxal phosphate-dependent protein [Granulicella aggregans]|uniref:D-serine deaminase-like pyridoxal phosphate-dependent protein n=1 Tax=Granulicella aggregans TaxID=474949 RepID=A0A7W8E569_9BACT|nr:alanine racemase [Granulicella aggregans]MBB5057905.1 D-serine deaminase-like pyridoxal phosphate-dependent protein [Granulicella aggregans]